MFGILGPLEVVLGNAPCVIAGARQRAALIFLLLHRGEVVSTDRLVDELWHGAPPRTATTSLHNAVSQLRQAVGDMLVTRPPGYVLEVGRDEIDAFRFEDLLERSAELEPAGRAAALRDALALWRGAALLDVAYEPFAVTAAARLEELRLVAVEELADAELALGRHDVLVPRLEALVAETPLRERLWGQLMLALYRAGRQGDASLAYQRARKVLVEELGIEPGPALKKLHGAIIRQDPELALRAGGAAAERHGDVADVVSAIVGGRVIPVLGEDAEELAVRLAGRFRYPPTERPEVARVSQFAAATAGYGPVRDEIRDWVVERRDEPNDVHRFFAALPPLLRERGAPQQLLVTTSYGRGLERAFAEAGEEVEVVSYIAFGRDRGRFTHLRPDGTSTLVETPNAYPLTLELRPVVLRLRGDVEPTGVVVTEDDYIEYLRRADVGTSVPVGVAAALRRSHYLFLGYTVRDWALRLVLGRMWGDEPVAYRSWAVQPSPGPAERELWRRVDVDLVETPIELYVRALADAIGVGAGAAT